MVRFSEVVKILGAPEVYLPLSDPKRDRNFMRAVREERVLSLKQEPTGTKKDFGTVGYLPDRYVSYLIFPKTLTAFKGQRVIGIKYDTLSQASLSTRKASVAARRRFTKAKTPPKPRPLPRLFTATVRLTATNDVQVTVEALNEKEARAKALDAARPQGDICFNCILAYCRSRRLVLKMRHTFEFLSIAALALQTCLSNSLGQAPTVPGQAPAVAPGQTAALGQGQALTFRVAGSSLSDASGANVGNIEALSIDRQSGKVTFAMVSLGFPENRTTVTPIPWQLLQHRSDAGGAGGIPGTFQQLTVPFSQQALRSAPQLNSQTMASTTDASWMATTRGYFAPLTAAGGVNAAAGIQTGAANGVGNPNAALNPSGTDPSLGNNPFGATNAPAGFTNRTLQQGATNAAQAAALPRGTIDPSLPAGTLPPGTVPAGALPPGTLPAGTLPPGTVPNDGNALPPANPGAPRKVPLAPARPVAPTK